jgi:hypothetical protein
MRREDFETLDLEHRLAEKKEKEMAVTVEDSADF